MGNVLRINQVQFFVEADPKALETAINDWFIAMGWEIIDVVSITVTPLEGGCLSATVLYLWEFKPKGVKNDPTKS